MHSPSLPGAAGCHRPRSCSLGPIFTGKISRAWAKRHAPLWLEEIDKPAAKVSKRGLGRSADVGAGVAPYVRPSWQLVPTDDMTASAIWRTPGQATDVSPALAFGRWKLGMPS